MRSLQERGVIVAKGPLAVFASGGAMFSNLWHVVGFLAWAEKNDRTPVVSFANATPSNRWVGDSGREGWSDYFRPVSNVDWRELGGESVYEFTRRPTEFPIQEYSISSEFRRLFHEHISLNAQSEDYLKPWAEAISGYSKVLGVHIRGTDMRVAKSHWAPPTLFQIGKTVDDALSRADFSHLLVATEDETALRFMTRRYGERVITTDSLRTSTRRKLVHLSSSIPQYRYFLGLQVLRDAWLLASCAGLVSGHSNVSEHVQVIAEHPFEVNLQIRRPQVDVLGGHPLKIWATNLARELTTSRWAGRDFRIIDRGLK